MIHDLLIVIAFDVIAVAIVLTVWRLGANLRD